MLNQWKQLFYFGRSLNNATYLESQNLYLFNSANATTLFIKRICFCVQTHLLREYAYASPTFNDSTTEDE